MLTFLLVIIYLSFISLGLPDGLLGSAWPIMHIDLSVPVYFGGFISLIISGGTIISSFFSSKVLKKSGTGFVTFGSVFLTAVSLFGFAFSTKYWQLCLWAVPYGLGAGSVDACLNNFVALHYKARHMSWLHCFWGIGASTGPFIMGNILATGHPWAEGYSFVGWIQISLTLILFLSLPAWKKSGLDFQSDNSDEKTKTIALKDLLKLKGAKPILISFFCYCALESTAGLWGASFMVFARGLNPEKAAKWVALFYFGITFGRFLSGFATVKLSSKNLVRTGLVFILLGIITIILPFSINFLPWGFFLLGLGCAPIYPSMLHSTPDNFGKEVSQSIMGIQMASAYVGSTFMPPFVGVLVDNVSPYWFVIMLFLILALMAFTTEKVNSYGLHKR